MALITEKNIDKISVEQIKKIKAKNPILAQKIIKLKKESLKNEYPYLFYRPNNKLKTFTKIFNDNFISGITGGNGCGKTSMIANIIANIVYPEQTEFFKNECFENWKFPREIRIVGTSKNVQDTGAIQTELRKWLVAGTYTSTKGNYGYTSQYFFPESGFNIEIMNYNQEIKEFEGPTKGLIIFDEPPTYEIYKANVSRLRLGGKMLFSYTPLDCAWLDDELVNKQEYGKRFFLTCSVYDNLIENGGILTPENVQQMINEYDEDDIDARVYGKSRIYSGRIIKEYDYQIHTQNIPISFETIIKNYKDYTFKLITDPHDRRPSANIIAAIDCNYNVYIIAEYPFYREKCFFQSGISECALPYHKIKDSSLTIEKTAAVLNQLLSEIGLLNQDITIHKVIDKNKGATPMSNTGKTIIETFADYHFNYEPAMDNDVSAGHSAIRDFLKVSSFTNLPKLFIFPHCYNTYTALLRYTWDDHTGRAQDSRHYKEKPKEKFKDFIDLLRYLLNVPKEKLFIKNNKIEYKENYKRNLNFTNLHF